MVKGSWQKDFRWNPKLFHPFVSLFCTYVCGRLNFRVFHVSQSRQLMQIGLVNPVRMQYTNNNNKWNISMSNTWDEKRLTTAVGPYRHLQQYNCESSFHFSFSSILLYHILILKCKLSLSSIWYLDYSFYFLPFDQNVCVCVFIIVGRLRSIGGTRVDNKWIDPVVVLLDLYLKCSMCKLSPSNCKLRRVCVCVCVLVL